MALETRIHENPLLGRHVNTCVLDVSVRLRLDVTQTSHQFLIICFDALKPFG